MKQEIYNIISEEVRNNLIAEILVIPCNSKFKVTISDAGTKSQKQRGLQWKWYSEVAKSGIGRYDDKNKIHLQSKHRWALPIFLRDDDFFADLYQMYQMKYSMDNERMKYFIDTQVHTEKLSTSQMAEYLTEFQHYWLSAGVNLTNPDNYGLKLS